MDILGLIIFIGFVLLRATAETRRKQEQTRRPPANVHPSSARPPVTTRPAPGRPVWPQAPTGPFGGPMLPRPDRPMAPVALPVPVPTIAPVPAPAASWLDLAEGEGTDSYQTLQGQRLSGLMLGEGEGSGEGEGVMEGVLRDEPVYRQPEPVRSAKPAKLEPAFLGPGLNGNDILRGVVMAEILAPPRSRRPQTVRPVPGIGR